MIIYKRNDILNNRAKELISRIAIAVDGNDVEIIANQNGVTASANPFSLA